MSCGAAARWRRRPPRRPEVRDVHVTVAAVVERDGRFLFVEEKVGGSTVINQPAGHWEAGETLAEAMAREALEETGWVVEPTGFLGIYEYHPPDLPYGFVRFAFRARALRHDATRKLDEGIERAVWMSLAELARDSARHRSPMVQRCVEDALSGKSLPLETIAHL